MSQMGQKPQYRLREGTAALPQLPDILDESRGDRFDCVACPLKMQCCPKEPVRKVPRSIYEEARDVARAYGKTEAYERSRRDRKKVEMLFAHLKRILRLDRLRLRGPSGAQFEFTLAAIAQNLRRLAKIVSRPQPAIVLGAA